MKPASILKLKTRLKPWYEKLPRQFHAAHAGGILGLETKYASRLIGEMFEMGWLKKVGWGKYEKLEVEE